jgi:ferredoxin
MDEVNAMGILGNWVESLDYKFEILPACTRYVSPHATCEICIQACESKAITLVKGKPVINEKKCNECGSCLPACPVQGIAGIYPERTIHQQKLILKDLDFPTEKELLILAKKGIKTIAVVNPASMEKWKERVAEVNVLLSELNETPLTISHHSAEADQAISRRECLSFLKKETKSVLKKAAPAKWRFNQSDFHLPKYYQGFQFAAITIDLEKCLLCIACEKLCRNKCFSIREDTFSIFAQGCSSCQLCVDICPEKAILVEIGISKAEEKRLPLYVNICKVCNKPFQTLNEQGEKCTACNKRESFNFKKEGK